MQSVYVSLTGRGRAMASTTGLEPVVSGFAGRCSFQLSHAEMVSLEGLEPSRLSARASKARVAANYTTPRLVSLVGLEPTLHGF